MTDSIRIHTACYIGALIICLTSLLYTLFRHRTVKTQNKLYVLLNILLCCNAVSCIVTAYFAPWQADSHAAVIVTEIFQLSYFLLHPLMTPLFFFYAMVVTGKIVNLKTLQAKFYALPALFVTLITLCNPIFHWVYYYDEARIFHRHWGEYVMYLVSAFYFLLTIRQLLFAWRALNALRRNALFYFISLTLAGILIQLYNIDIKSELFAEAVAAMGLMLIVESEEDRIDADTGFYNRRALKMDLDHYFVNRLRFYIICIKIENTDIIRRITGSSNLEILSDILSEYLSSLIPRYYIYHPTPDTFLLTVMNADPSHAAELACQISRRFEEKWDYSGTEFQLDSVIMYAKAPEEMKNTNDIFYMCDQPAPASTKKNPLSGGDLNYLVHRLEIENAIQKAVTGKRFQVYYQPTYTIDGKLHGAEALVRLFDEDLGFISPEEFIPVAEQMGFIDEIDDFVLHSVCEFLHSGIPAQNGIESINVNLSVIQCMQSDFVKHIGEIVTSHDIPQSQINFEITESVAAKDYHILNSIIKQMKNSGFLFSMDDYGTGYSNMVSIFSLNFDVIKIDKSILWEAMKNERGMIILESSINMIKMLGRKILVEGVETAKQLEILKKLGVDYLQGYYFSKPIPMEQFVEHIRHSIETPV